FIGGKNFYGVSLHDFYVPELETVSETKAKLVQRRRDVTIRIKRNQQDMTNPDVSKFIPKEQYHRKKKNPALPLTQARQTQHYPGEILSSIYDGIPQNLDPRPVSELSLPSTSYSHLENNSVPFASSQAPYHPNEAIIRTRKHKETTLKSEGTKNKRKNYKGQYVNNNVKIRVVRPQLGDTSSIVKWDTSNKNVVSNPKKLQSNMTIKLIPKSGDDRKRIIIKDPSVSQLVEPSEDLQCLIKEAKSQVVYCIVCGLGVTSACWRMTRGVVLTTELSIGYGEERFARYLFLRCVRSRRFIAGRLARESDLCGKVSSPMSVSKDTRDIDIDNNKRRTPKEDVENAETSFVFFHTFPADRATFGEERSCEFTL
ncbi:hypothetical protein WH47_06135, partial [Habropoda laboriosa]